MAHQSPTEQQIAFKLSSLISNELNHIPTNKLIKALGEEMVKIVRERTNKGKTIGSKNMKKYSKNYKKNKKNVQKREIRRYGKTEFASKAVSKPNLRLTGNMFSSINYKVSSINHKGRVSSKSKSNYNLDMELYIKGKRNQKVSGYVSKARPWFGLAISGNQVKKEQQRLKNVVNKFLQHYTKIDIKTN